MDYATIDAVLVRETKEFLSSTTNPEELHLFAQMWNWDCGVEEMLQLIMNPCCDAGTALLVFWYGGAESFYLHYRTLQDCRARGEERDTFRLLLQIERRFTKGQFATSRMAFDPKPHMHMEEWKSEFARRIPEAMYEPSTSRKQTATKSGKRCFEFKDATTKKFWNIELKGSSHTVQFGKIGTDGQKRIKEFGTRNEAKKSYETLIGQKTGKGYKEVKGSAPKTSRVARKKHKKLVVRKKRPSQLKAEGRLKETKKAQSKSAKKKVAKKEVSTAKKKTVRKPKRKK